MKTLVVKGDNSPVKSRVHAVRILNEQGIDKSKLYEENGLFYYDKEETQEEPKVVVEKPKAKKEVVLPTEIDWDIPVYPDGINNLKLQVKNTDIEAILMVKHPAGQSILRPYAALEVKIGEEAFIMSLELCKKLFEIKGV